MQKPPTLTQLSVLDFIRQFLLDRGFPPTMQEIADQFGYRSLNSVKLHLDALQRKGYIERSHQARALKILERT